RAGPGTGGKRTAARLPARGQDRLSELVTRGLCRTGLSGRRPAHATSSWPTRPDPVGHRGACERAARGAGEDLTGQPPDLPLPPSFTPRPRRLLESVFAASCGSTEAARCDRPASLEAGHVAVL